MSYSLLSFCTIQIWRFCLCLKFQTVPVVEEMSLEEEHKSSVPAVFPGAFSSDLAGTDFRSDFPVFRVWSSPLPPGDAQALAASSYFRQESLASRTWKVALGRPPPTFSLPTRGRVPRWRLRLRLLGLSQSVPAARILGLGGPSGAAVTPGLAQPGPSPGLPAVGEGGHTPRRAHPSLGRGAAVPPGSPPLRPAQRRVIPFSPAAV